MLKHKTDWKNSDIVDADEMNRIEGNVKAVEDGKIEKPMLNRLIVPVAGWVDCSVGSYRKQIEVEVSGLLAVDAFNAVVTLETEGVAQDCGLAANCGTEDGKIVCYAEKMPTVEIVLEYYIIEGKEVH